MTDVITDPVIPAQTTAPATEPSGWMSPEGEIRDGAPENVVALMEAKKFTNIGQIVDAYSELEKFTGIGKHLVIPEADDAEGWGKVYDSMGRPETHDKYELGYEGDVQLSDELVGQFKQFAHGLGLTQKQFDQVVNFQLDAVAAQTVEYEKQTEAQKVADKEANIAALTESFGAENYLQRVTDARTMAEKLGIYETLEKTGLASDPVIIGMLDKLANADAEGAIHPAPPTQPAKTLHDRMAEIKKSPAFLEKFHEDHKTIMVEYMALNQEIANAGESKAPRG